MNKHTAVENNLKVVLKQYLQYRELNDDHDYDKRIIVSELLEAIACNGHAEEMTKKLKK